MSKATAESIIKTGICDSIHNGVSLLELEIMTRELLKSDQSYNNDLNRFTLEELKEVQAMREEGRI